MTPFNFSEAYIIDVRVLLRFRGSRLESSKSKLIFLKRSEGLDVLIGASSALNGSERFAAKRL